MKNSAETRYNAVIIGSGPGGYVAAIRCAQLGLKTAVIEKGRTFGGTCLNVGCIPSKALLDSTEFLSSISSLAANHGIMIDNPKIKIDLKQMMKRKEQIVSKMTLGVKSLLTNYKIDTFEGHAKLKNNHSIIIENNDGSKREIDSDKIIIAVGSVPSEIPGLPVNGRNIIDSTGALALDEVPGKLAIIGAGAIGLELGSIWKRLGSDVTVIEMMENILPLSDPVSAARLAQILKKQGFNFRLNSKVVSADETNGKLKLTITDNAGVKSELICDKLLVAAGRIPLLKNLGLEEAGIKLNSSGKRILVNNKFETSAPDVYAIGDVIDGPMLAHKASEEGIAAAGIISGGYGEVNYKTIPSVVYTWPEYASVGKGEIELAGEGISFKSGIFQMRANGRALAGEFTEGFVKIFSDSGTDELLGAQIIGPWASDLISEIVTVMEFEGTSEDIARTVHAHPTLSEVVKEAAMDLGGWSIHSLSK